MTALLKKALAAEPEGPGWKALAIELENMRIAGETGLPACQDTGTAVVFSEPCNRVAVSGETISRLINQGISDACLKGFSEPSQVYPPLSGRENTGNSTPAAVHIEQVQGSTVKLSLAVSRTELDRFPAFVAWDIYGNSIYQRIRSSR
ncbi:hypothetical protein CSA37_06630 [Candidatus Fermentibacteria bacterium]|nr:MAG: hypothetical protein CSA37_06630 [Candidatus Fermentibacteria bacterium]